MRVEGGRDVEGGREVEGGKEVMGIWRRRICKIILNFNHFSYIYLVLNSWNRMCSTGMGIGIKWAGMYSSSSSAVLDSSSFLSTGVLDRSTVLVSGASLRCGRPAWLSVQPLQEQTPRLSSSHSSRYVLIHWLTKSGRHVQWSVVLSLLWLI